MHLSDYLLRYQVGKIPPRQVVVYPKDTTKEGKEGIDKGLLGEVLDRSFSLSLGRVVGWPSLSQQAKGWHSVLINCAWYIKQAGTIQVGCRPVQLVLKVTLVHCWWTELPIVAQL